MKEIVNTLLVEKQFEIEGQLKNENKILPINFQNSILISEKIFFTNGKPKQELREYFLPFNNYGQSKLLEDLEENEFQLVKNKLRIEDLNDADMLKFLSLIMCDKAFSEKFQIESSCAISIISEAKFQLNLIGEETSEIIDAYDLS